MAEMMRFNKGKVQLSQIPTRFLKGLARTYEYGQIKYERGNFRTPLKNVDELLEKVVDPLERHIAEVKDALESFRYHKDVAKFREEIADVESLLPGTGAIIWNAIQLTLQCVLLGLIPEDPGQTWLENPKWEELKASWDAKKKELKK